MGVSCNNDPTRHIPLDLINQSRLKEFHYAKTNKQTTDTFSVLLLLCGCLVIFFPLSLQECYRKPNISKSVTISGARKINIIAVLFVWSSLSVQKVTSKHSSLILNCSVLCTSLAGEYNHHSYHKIKTG